MRGEASLLLVKLTGILFLSNVKWFDWFKFKAFALLSWVILLKISYCITLFRNLLCFFIGILFGTGLIYLSFCFNSYPYIILIDAIFLVLLRGEGGTITLGLSFKILQSFFSAETLSFDSWSHFPEFEFINWVYCMLFCCINLLTNER